MVPEKKYADIIAVDVNIILSMMDPMVRGSLSVMDPMVRGSLNPSVQDPKLAFSGLRSINTSARSGEFEVDGRKSAFGALQSPATEFPS